MGSTSLGRESARLDRVFLYADKSHPTFVVTRDYSIGWGSYNGPVSYFLEVSDAGIRYILPHGLMTSLKTAWAIDNKGSSTEIISKKCRPNFGTGNSTVQGFTVIYERFSFDGESWNGRVHDEDGFWENTGPLDEQEFRKMFPEDSRNCFERVYLAMQVLAGSASMRRRLELVNQITAPLLMDDFPEHVRDSVATFRGQIAENNSDETSDDEREKLAKAFLSIYTKTARLEGVLQDFV